MMGKTHTSCGIASALVFTPPTTLTGVAAAVALGALGGAIPDIDLYSRKNRSIFVGNVVIGVIIVTIATLAIDIIFKLQILERILQHTGIYQIIGFGAFLILSLMSMPTPHRSFSHSLLALVLFTTSIYMMFPESSKFFAVGFISHLLLDITNKKDIKLFYPAKKGLSVKWFHASGTANKVFFVIGCGVSCVAAVMRIVILIKNR